jgi:hypothetical protein
MPYICLYIALCDSEALPMPNHTQSGLNLVWWPGQTTTSKLSMNHFCKNALIKVGEGAMRTSVCSAVDSWHAVLIFSCRGHRTAPIWHLLTNWSRVIALDDFELFATVSDLQAWPDMSACCQWTCPLTQ